MSTDELLNQIEDAYETGDSSTRVDELIEQFLAKLEAGQIRAASPSSDGDGWTVDPRVKKGILLGFSTGDNEPMASPAPFQFRDNEYFPTQDLPGQDRNIRVVPGGSTVRRGAYLDRDVTIMPPAYVNVGAYVDAETMVDSHALVGSCAQVGRRVHLSAGAQLGGVLEPVGQVPVVIEQGAFIGGNTGVFEGVRVGKRAVIGAGVNLTSSVPVYDLVNQSVHSPRDGEPLQIPPRAVVVPGTRPVSGLFGDAEGLQVQTPLIVKYRDESTDANAALEDALR